MLVGGAARPGLGGGAGAGQTPGRGYRRHRPGQGRPPGRRQSARTPWSTPAACFPAGGGGAGRADRHAEQPRHGLLAVLGHGHCPGPAGGLGSVPAAGQAVACRRAARHPAQLEVGGGNGPVHHFHHLQQPPAAGEFAAASGREAAPDLEAIYGLEFIRDLAAGSLARNSSPTTSPRTPSTSTAIHGCWPAPARWRRQRPRSCSGPGLPSSAWKSNRNCTATGSAPAPWSTVLGPVTKSYVDHLLAASASGSYGVLVAALLPCFWLYAEVGTDTSRPVPRGRRPGGAPLCRMAADLRRRRFRAATREAIAMVDDAGRKASGDERAAMVAGLQAVVPARSGFLRRAAAARLTAEGRGSRYDSRARFRIVSAVPTVVPITDNPPEPASFAAEGKISVF